jgi:predicted cobalt transporter CbtA
VNWYPKSDSEWHPNKPTVAQVAFGVAFFLALAGLALFWAAGESDEGNRNFLWGIAGLALVLGIWRIATGVSLAGEGWRRRRAIRSL